VSGPDEFDPALMRQEIAIEYQRLRTKFIQQQSGLPGGGFLAELDPEGEYDEENKRVSRFKAARLIGVGN